MNRDHLPRWLVPAFVVAAALTLVFGGLLLWHILRPEPPAGPVQDWMTPGLVAHVYHLPQPEMEAIFGPPPKDGSRKSGATLAEIAKAQGVATDEFVARVQAAVDASKAAGQ